MGEISDALRRATRERPHPPARIPSPREAEPEEESADSPVADAMRRSEAEAAPVKPVRSVERVDSRVEHEPVSTPERDPQDAAPDEAAEAAPPRRPRRLSRPVASPTRARAGEAEPELELDEVCALANEGAAPSAARVSLLDPSDPGAVAARQLAQQVKRQADMRDLHSIVVTSPLSGDGKTTVSCNLAVALSRLDRSRSIGLLELDLRRPTMARDFGLVLDAGVDDALEGTVSIDEAVRRTDVPGLDIVPVRIPRAAPEPLLASLQLRELIHTLERRYSLLIVDTPPVLAVSDTAAVLEVVDGCILVARAGSCPSKSIQRAMEYIPSDKALGCCLNYARRQRAAVDYDTYTSHPGLDAERAAAEARQ